MKKRSVYPKINWLTVAHDVLLVAWVAFAVIVAQNVVCFPALWIFGRANYETPLFTSILSAVVYIVTAFLVIIVPGLIDKKYKATKENLGLSELPTYTDIGLSALGFIATLLVSGIILNILQNLNLVDSTQVQDVGYSNLINGTDRAVAFIALVVVTPFFEELIFRGWLYRRLKKKSGIAAAIILTAVLFGVLHGQWNVGITVGVMSVIMCIEQELTDTIHAGILTHMLKNGIAFWLLYVVMGV